MFGKYYYSQADFVEAANAGKWERLKREMQANLEAEYEAKYETKFEQTRAETWAGGKAEGMAELEDNYILRLLKRNKPAENIVDTLGCEYNQVVKVAKQHNLPLL